MSIVQKFGGSSLAGAERIRRSAAIAGDMRRSGKDVVVVVSAMGESTDELSRLAHEIDPSPSKRELDALLSSGEQQSAALMAMALRAAGLPAISLTGWQSGIFTNSRHSDADIEQTLPWRVSEALRQGLIPVVTGFQGVDIKGDITTLGRGGSDTTAVALAAALGAERCMIYSDVPGVFTADPRLIKEARHIERMDIRDMLTLSHAGSQLLHWKCVELALEQGVSMELLSSFGDNGMSLVCPLSPDSRPDYAGVTRDTEHSRLTLVGRACTAQTLRDVVYLLKNEGIDALGGRAGEGFIWVQTDPAQLTFAMELVHRMYFLS